MPPKTPGPSYSGKPVRRLRLPKIGPSRAKSLFEEYFHVLLAVTFLAIAILGKAGGLSAFNAVVVGGWITAFIWFASQLKGYFAEKAKAANGKAQVMPPQEPADTQKGALPLPPGMKPMIGPQWPVKPGARPAWPRLPKRNPTPAAQTPVSKAPPVQTPVIQTPSAATTETNSEGKKRSFVYERPTLPDRRPQLPNNWPKPDKKPKR